MASSSTTFTFSNRGLTSFDAIFHEKVSSEDSSSAFSSLIEPRQLCTLDVSFNQISDIRSANHPSLAWLESLDLSNNSIRALPPPPHFPPHLRKLDVSHNFLQSLAPLSGCRFLISLKASHNALTMLPSSSAELIVAGSSSPGSSGLLIVGGEGLPRDLASLDVSNNGIAAFDGALSKLKRLHTLRVQNNELAMLEDVVDQVRQLPDLRYLHVAGNPCFANATGARDCAARRQAIVAECAALRSLDGVAVAPHPPKLLPATATTSAQHHHHHHHHHPHDAAAGTGEEIPSYAAARSRSRSPASFASPHQKAAPGFDAVNARARDILICEINKQTSTATSSSSTTAPSSSALRPRRENESAAQQSNVSCSRNQPQFTDSCPSSAVAGNNSNTHAIAAQQMRDERRRCQALREMLQREMQQEGMLKASTEQLQRQVRQEQGLQRTQLASLAQLRKECEQAQLEVERRKTDIAEEQLHFLELHAESRERRAAVASAMTEGQL